MLHLPWPLSQLSVVIFCNFLLQFTLFSGFLVLDAKRMKASRIDVLCCIRTPKSQQRTTDFAKRFFEKKYLPFVSWLPVQIISVLFSSNKGKTKATNQPTQQKKIK